MAFDPNSPSESHAVLSGDIDQIRENCVQLRKHENGAAAPSNLVAGMLWYDTTGPYLKIRRSDNGGWYYVYLGTQACVEAGLTVTPAQINNLAQKGVNNDITSMTGLDANGIPNAVEWNGAAKTISTSDPSGGDDGDIWFKYTT